MTEIRRTYPNLSYPAVPGHIGKPLLDMLASHGIRLCVGGVTDPVAMGAKVCEIIRSFIEAKTDQKELSPALSFERLLRILRVEAGAITLEKIPLDNMFRALGSGANRNKVVNHLILHEVIQPLWIQLLEMRREVLKHFFEQLVYVLYSLMLVVDGSDSPPPRILLQDASASGMCELMIAGFHAEVDKAIDFLRAVIPSQWSPHAMGDAKTATAAMTDLENSLWGCGGGDAGVVGAAVESKHFVLHDDHLSAIHTRLATGTQTAHPDARLAEANYSMTYRDHEGPVLQALVTERYNFIHT